LDVLAVALDDPDEDIRCAAAAGLGRSGDERAARPLLHHLRPFAPWDSNLRLRAATARALGQLGCPEAEPRLVQVLQRTSWVRRSQCDELRAIAAEALLRIGTSGALRAVADRMDRDRSPAIKQAAAVALAGLRERRGGVARPTQEAVHVD
jgi:HEAT repeat protein